MAYHRVYGILTTRMPDCHLASRTLKQKHLYLVRIRTLFKLGMQMNAGLGVSHSLFVLTIWHVSTFDDYPLHPVQLLNPVL